MALHGKFVINDAYYCPLSFPGVGTFLAFSGDGAYRNRGACGMKPAVGPVPAGKYWIVDRPDGGIKSQAITTMKDFWSMKKLKAYGTIEVIANGKVCP